jgi:hypothetical protein
MWIATEHGFYSAVENRNNHDTVIVRARVRDDLTKMVTTMGWDDVTIVDSPRADYPHRVTITKNQWAHFVATAATGIDYPNFKSRVGKHDPGRSYVYHDVWATLIKLEKKNNKDRWHYSATLTPDQIDALDDDWDDDVLFGGVTRSIGDGPIGTDDAWLCPDCDETLIGHVDRCPYCHCEIEWFDVDDEFDDESAHAWA